METETDHFGMTTTYTYDTNNNLVSISNGIREWSFHSWNEVWFIEPDKQEKQMGSKNKIYPFFAAEKSICDICEISGKKPSC